MNGFDQRDGARARVMNARGASHSRALAGGLRGWWSAVLLAALLAFTWQSFVIQTHRHWADDLAPSAAAAAAVDAGGGARLQADRSSSDLPASCPICQEIAHAGHYLLPAGVSVDLPAPLAFWAVASFVLALSLRRRSHGWQSRAPPQTFQA